MSNSKNPSSGTPDFLGQLGSWFETADKGLDQAGKSVEKKREELEALKRAGRLDRLAVNIREAYLEGFREDLREDGVIGEEKQRPYLNAVLNAWDKEQMNKKSEIILNSPELIAIEEFSRKVENLPLLQKLMAEAEPQQKWQALLAGYIEKVPGLEKLLGNSQISTFLSSMGLGFLMPQKNKEETEENTEGKKAPEEEKTEGEAKEESDKEASDKERPDKEQEANEVIPQRPKSTIFFGDSNTVAMTSKAKDILDVDGKIQSHASGGQSVKWGFEEIEKMADQKPSPLKDFENAVILFGTNDLLAFSPTQIQDYLKRSYLKLKEAGVKNVYAVTIPPFGSYGPYNKTEKAENTRTAVNEWIRKKAKKEGKVHHVIDLAAREKEGGIADNDKSSKLCEDAHSGDGIHFDKKLLARVYQRELEYGSGMNKQDNA